MNLRTKALFSLLLVCLCACQTKEDIKDETINETSEEIVEKDVEESGFYLADIYIPEEFGHAKYTTDEIAQMKGLSAQQLQEKISTISDMIQYIVENDYGVYSLVYGDYKYKYNGITWSLNRTPQQALDLSSNSCGSISNLARYILEDDYDAEGYILWGDENPTDDEHGGHIFNYFVSQGIKYTFDFTTVMQLKRYKYNTKQMVQRNWVFSDFDKLNERIDEYNKNPKTMVHTVLVVEDTHEDHPVVGATTNKLTWFIDAYYKDKTTLIRYDKDYLSTLDYFEIIEQYSDYGFDPSTIPYEDMGKIPSQDVIDEIYRRVQKEIESEQEYDVHDANSTFEERDLVSIYIAGFDYKENDAIQIIQNDSYNSSVRVYGKAANDFSVSNSNEDVIQTEKIDNGIQIKAIEPGNAKIIINYNNNEYYFPVTIFKDNRKSTN